MPACGRRARRRSCSTSILREEREHAERLEARLEEALTRLETEKDKVFTLKIQLAEARHAQNGLADLRQQVTQLAQRLEVLEETGETRP